MDASSTLSNSDSSSRVKKFPSLAQNNLAFYTYSAECLDFVEKLLQTLSPQVGFSKTPAESGNSLERDATARIENELKALPLASSLMRHDVALYVLAEFSSLGLNIENDFLEDIFSKCRIEAMLEAINRILSDLSQSDCDSHLMTAFPLVLSTIRLHVLRAPKSNVWNLDHIKNNATIQDVIVPQILRLPILLSNACHSQKYELPSWAVRDVYYDRLICCCSEMMTEDKEDESIQNAQDTPLHTYMHTLIARLVGQAGACQTVARALWKMKEIDVWGGLSASRDRIKLLSSLVREPISTPKNLCKHNYKAKYDKLFIPYLSSVCLPCLNKSLSLAKRFTTDALLSQQTGTKLENRYLAYVITELLSQCQLDDQENSDSTDNEETPGEKDRSTLEVVVRHITTIWIQRHFVLKSVVPIQERATFFLCESLPRLENITTASSLIQDLVNGVSLRLDVSQNNARIQGMRVAQVIANKLGSGDVHFSELDQCSSDDEEIDEEESQVNNDSIVLKTSRVITERSHRYLDPDAEYETSDDEADENVRDDDSIEWEDDLIPLPLEDDEEDLSETPKPLYLRDCLALLHTLESHPHAISRQETGLRCLESLVRSRPYDLPDVAIPMVQQLLSMENKFGMEDFDDILLKNLVSMAVCESHSVGDVIIQDIFDDCSLHRRILGLSTLELAAQEMCGQKKVGKGCAETRNSIAKVAGKKRLVESGNEITRQWGKLRHKGKSSDTVVNRFTAIAPRWFYGLLASFMDRKNEVALWGGANGARLLSSMIVTMAFFVEASGPNSQTTWLLAHDLIEFAWTFRSSDDSTLRVATLIALATSFSVVDESTLLQILNSGSMNLLPEFLGSVAREDPEEGCRNMAKVISRTVMENLKRTCVPGVNMLL